MRDFNDFLKKTLGIEIGEKFYIKVPEEIDTSYKTNFIPVYIDNFGNIRYHSEDIDQQEPENLVDIVVCTLNNEKDDFFWRVTLGELLSNALSFAKELTPLAKGTVLFLQEQGIEKIEGRTHDWYCLKDKDDKEKRQLFKDKDSSLFKGIEELFQYYPDENDISISAFKQKINQVYGENVF